MRGVGVGQVVSIGIVATYYSSIMAITLKYLADSFSAVLPWRDCKPEWGSCIPSNNDNANISWTNETKSSAELYFMCVVLKEDWHFKIIENLLISVGKRFYVLRTTLTMASVRQTGFLFVS